MPLLEGEWAMLQRHYAASVTPAQGKRVGFNMVLRVFIYKQVYVSGYSDRSEVRSAES